MDARHFLSWYRKRRVCGRAVSPATVNKVLRECQRIFREAVDCGFVQSNPFSGIRQTKVGQGDWHYVSPEEYHRLLAACPSRRWRGMVSLAYCCGLRVGAILSLTWADVDFRRHEIRIVKKREEGKSVGWVPKDKDMRVVPVPGSVLETLGEIREEAEAGQCHLFVNGKGISAGQQIKRQNVWRDFQAIRRRATVPACSMHDLRRSYCTNLASEVPMHVVQELAGHSDIRTTRQYYLQVRPELLAQVRRTLDRLVAVK